MRFMYFQKWNCVALFPIPTFMYLWPIYIFPASVCLFGCSKIGRCILEIYKSLTDTWMWKLGDRNLYFCFGNNEALPHFWEYINQNHTFILDSHRPLICSVHCTVFILPTIGMFSGGRRKPCLASAFSPDTSFALPNPIKGRSKQGQLVMKLAKGPCNVPAERT